MTTENPYGTSATSTGNIGMSQSGTTTGRSPEYEDGLTVQDTSHSAAPADTLGNVGSTGGANADAPDAPGGAASISSGSTRTTSAPHHAPTANTHELGDNRDGAGRDRTDAFHKNESATLISADKVVGTAVYDAVGECLGTIDSVMLNKRSGEVAYAVMSFGGFLGIGERFHPLPWDVLTYDQGKGGYNIQHSADDMRKAPNYGREEVSNFDYDQRGGEIDDYYGVNVARGGSRTGGTAGTAGSPGMGGSSGGAANVTRQSTGIEAADAIGSTTGVGSSGMASTGMGSNRNY